MKIKISNYSTAKCNDSIFGQIKYNNGCWFWKSLNKKRHQLLRQSQQNVTFKNYNKTLSNNPIVILILESPHSDEFTNKKNPCAACGISGKSIANHLCDIFNNNAKYKNNSNILKSYLNNCKASTLDIWVVNSVQYQCSLGITPVCNLIKESNWIDEWYSKRNNFLSRFAYLQNGNQNYVIINLCTKGVFVPMKEIVKDLLTTNNIIQNNYCEGPHPASWERLKYVEIR